MLPASETVVALVPVTTNDDGLPMRDDSLDAQCWAAMGTHISHQNKDVDGEEKKKSWLMKDSISFSKSILAGECTTWPKLITNEWEPSRHATPKKRARATAPDDAKYFTPEKQTKDIQDRSLTFE